MIKLKPILKTNRRRIHNPPLEKLFYQMQKGLCFYCGRPMSHDDDGKKSKVSKDHLFPRSHGFGLGGNFVYAHVKCNNRKQDRYPTPAEIVRFCEMYRQRAGKTEIQNHIFAVTKEGKPRFKLVLTPELIHDYTS
jgi:CRISPR/Cas system Type II protein with McrA/HNH and RuvC-like nuclease domain